MKLQLLAIALFGGAAAQAASTPVFSSCLNCQQHNTVLIALNQGAVDCSLACGGASPVGVSAGTVQNSAN